jgi:hypothetical protein
MRSAVKRYEPEPPNGVALTAGTAIVVSGTAGGVAWVVVAPTVMPELVTVAIVACSWLIAMVRAPIATTALPPITAASFFTSVRLVAFTVFAPI